MKKFSCSVYPALFTCTIFLAIAFFSCSKRTPFRDPLRDSWVVTTLAGNGLEGFKDETGKKAQFREPRGIVMDAQGNLYVADKANHRIRKVTPEGVVTTLAGTGNGAWKDDPKGELASFNYPSALTIDRAGNLYVADEGNNMIRKVTTGQNPGIVTTIAGSGGNQPDKNSPSGRSADIYTPRGIALDSAGATLYVAEASFHKIRTVSTVFPHPVDTYSGSGVGSGDSPGQFDTPTGVGIDSEGSIYVADRENNKIRKITNKIVTSPLGSGFGSWVNGVGKKAGLNHPTALTFDAQGNMFIADFENRCVRKVLMPQMEVRTFAGGPARPVYADGDAAGEAGFANPAGIVYDKKNNIVYVTDAGNHCIRKISYRIR